VPWKFVHKLVFNTGLVNDLILLRKALSLNLAIAFGKGFLFLSPGSAQEKFAAIVNLGNKPTRVNWAMAQCLGILWKSCCLMRVS
jgi:hypothetical protein